MSKHHGSCHCGAVQYDFEGELEGLATCNCSICGRTGALMKFVPYNAIENLAGRDKLVDYQFGRKSLHHVFCGTCGCRPLAWGTGPDGSEMAMVNVRCIDGIDVHQLSVSQQYDGKTF